MMVEEWAYYDGVPNGDWDRVEVIDVLVTASVNAWLNAAVVRTIHRGLANACDDLLGAIPRDADLLGGGSTTVEKLLGAACSVREVGIARATKVLHRKRPRLVPMLDAIVLGYYFVQLGRPDLAARAKQSATTTEEAMFVMELFRADLEHGQSRLSEISARLERDGTPITTVRLLELLVWCSVETVGSYRL